MATLHVEPNDTSGLCERCGTPIDFLSSCPQCGTVAGIDPILSDAVGANHPEWAFGDDINPLSEQAQWGPPRTLSQVPLGPADAGLGDAGPRNAGPRNAGPRNAGPREPGLISFGQPQPPLRTVGKPEATPLQQPKPVDMMINAWDVISVGEKRLTRFRRTWKRTTAVVVGTAVLAGAGAFGIIRATSPVPPPKLTVRQFAAPGAPFAVAFQSAPTKATAPERLAGKPYEATTYTAFADGSTYSASVYPFPLGRPTMSATQFLKVFTSHIGIGDFVALPNARPETFRGLPGLYTVLETPGGGIYLNVLAVLSGHIGYVLTEQATTPAPPGFWNFANSFHLLPTS